MRTSLDALLLLTLGAAVCQSAHIGIGGTADAETRSLLKRSIFQCSDAEVQDHKLDRFRRSDPNEDTNVDSDPKDKRAVMTGGGLTYQMFPVKPSQIAYSSYGGGAYYTGPAPGGPPPRPYPGLPPPGRGYGPPGGGGYPPPPSPGGAGGAYPPPPSPGGDYPPPPSPPSPGGGGGYPAPPSPEGVGGYSPPPLPGGGGYPPPPPPPTGVRY